MCASTWCQHTRPSDCRVQLEWVGECSWSGPQRQAGGLSPLTGSTGPVFFVPAAQSPPSFLPDFHPIKSGGHSFSWRSLWDFVLTQGGRRSTWRLWGMTFPPWKKSSLLLPWPAPAACLWILCGVRVRCGASSSHSVLMRKSHRTRSLTPLSY